MCRYTLGDYIWIWLQPAAVPANRTVRSAILVHHIVTLALLAFPLRYPALRVFACWDTLAEINTFLRILRRVLWPKWQRLVGMLYWSTFVAFRGVLYPYLLVRFYYEMQVGEESGDREMCYRETSYIGCSCRWCMQPSASQRF